MHAVGTIDLFARFWRKSEMPGGLPQHTLALTCPVTVSNLENLPPDLSPATVTFGQMQLGAHQVIAMKFAGGGVELLWLADAQDPDVWVAINSWKQVGAVPVVLGVEEQGEERYRFFLPTMHANALPVSELLGWADGWGETEPWTSMVAFSETHGAAFPLMSTRVPPVPRTAGFGALKYLGSE